MTASGLVAGETTQDVTVKIPCSAKNGISLSRGDSLTGVKVVLENTDSVHFTGGESRGTAIKTGKDGLIAVPTIRGDGSLQINTVINSSSAPRRYVDDFNIQGGAHLVEGADGVVDVEDSHGFSVAGIMPPWAIGHKEAKVPTHFEIEGMKLVQVIDLDSNDIAYPVVADPWLWRGTISRTEWSYTVKKDPRLLVSPTTWGRTWSGATVWGEQWGEVMSKTKTH